MAIVNYEADKGHFPPAYRTDEKGQPQHSWRVFVLPYLDDPVATEIYNKYRFDEPWNGPNNRRLANRMPNVYRCPDEMSQNPLHTSYVAIVGADTMWPSGDSRRLDEIKDGTSKTILLVEQPNSGIHWMEPRDGNVDALAILDPGGPRNHGGSVIVCSFGDGHTSPQISIESAVFRGLVTVDGAEEISWEAW